VGISYHTLDAYGFHALEMLQCLCERRRGGETGVKAVQCLVGAEAWKAKFDRQLLKTAWSRREGAEPSIDELEKRVPNPTAFQIEYRDGFRATILTLNPINSNWAIAWNEAGETKSTLFWTQ